ncbi:MAG: peptidase MA family metallohydrolase [Melioribacteraceae bacterium]|nr:peptidase MA family metallohydrolase [Melioribacteraceae bacterium]
MKNINIKLKCFFVLTFFLLTNISFAQFGQNKVNYKNYDWYFIQTKHFDIYFTQGGEQAAEFTAFEAEKALASIQKDLKFEISNRISIIIYNSHNDFQETNVTDEYLSRGTGGFTEPFKNRVVFPFEGSYKKFQHVIAHELVHAVMRDLYYGGTIQNIISRGITLQLPIWFWEGTAEYLSQGWETNSDMFIRNAIMNDALPDIPQLNGYLAYRGGQSLFRFIAETYGREKIGELINKTQNLNGFEQALKSSIGIDLEELNERWKKSVKKEFWPDIKDYVDPDIFAKRLTNNRKDGGFYNASPAISPQGDKIAFISDRDIFLNVYIMDATDGKVIKKIVESGRTTDFEELSVLHPSLTWAPDNKRVALSLKSGGYDVVTIINTETNEKEELPFKLPGIESVNWSRDGKKIALIGLSNSQSDIFIYDFDSKELINLTNDIFSDSDPIWSPDNKFIYFSSDRGNNLLSQNNNFEMYKHNYKQLDLYSINISTKELNRITNWENSDEKYSAISSNGNDLIFVSDYNGINNIYRMKIENGKPASKAIPITNSLSEINQISISANDKKLVFSSLYNLGYNIYMLNNPFEMKVESDTLKLTNYMTSVLFPKISNSELTQTKAEIKKEDKTVNDTTSVAVSDTTSNTRIFVGQYISKKDEKIDSTSSNYKRFVFTNNKMESDSARIAKRNKLFTEKLDDEGNFIVNKYKVNFSPDLVYANAGYSTLYGLLGTTILSFSDVLGNHRLIGQTSLQIDVKNSDYGLAYFYLKERLDVGFQAFHTARFLYRSTFFGDELYRFRNFGFVATASYPFSRFYRMDFGLSLLKVSSENLDNYLIPTESTTFLLPSLSFVHDNVLWGYTSPIEGTRYNLTAFSDPGIVKSRQSFFSFTLDYRKYFRFWYDNSFVFRFSGGASVGGNAQRFFVGGTDNWINRAFKTGGIPISSASDFAFLTPALPLRGYDYAEQMGTKYALLNLEFRVPVIRYLLTGGLPLFFQNILGVAFFDAGSAWDNTNKLKFIGTNQFGDTVTKDLLLGTGVGFRIYMLFLWRIDIAWKYDLDKFSKPRYYFSIGLDF